MSARSEFIKALPCLACKKEKFPGGLQCGKTEEHHLNLGHHAGQVRLGDDYSVPLGVWHHRGDPPHGMTASEATFVFGPSLARSPNRFREAYGSDEDMLESTNDELARLLPATA